MTFEALKLRSDILYTKSSYYEISGQKAFSEALITADLYGTRYRKSTYKRRKRAIEFRVVKLRNANLSTKSSYYDFSARMSFRRRWIR